MSIFSNSSLFLLGLVLLIASSDWLIQSSVKLSYIFRLTPLFIGLIVVAFGTSAPEAGVGITAAIMDQKDIALGNIIGSNISNIGLILGLCAMVVPLKVNKSIFKRELPIMLSAVLLFYLLSLDKVIGRLDGVIFIIFFIVFIIVSYKGSKDSFDQGELDNFKFRKIFRKANSKPIIFALAFVSLIGVMLGAYLMVKSGARLAAIFGISPWIIGITVFAIGTSLPELVASLSASLRKVPSISVGNIVGSNIFNILFVLGIVALIRPIRLSSSLLGFEFLALLFFSVIICIFMRTGYKISRKEGLVLFLSYLIFLFYIFSR